MLYNDMEMNLFCEAHAGEEKRNEELSERLQVLQLIVSQKVLPKLITNAAILPFTFFFSADG